MPAYLDAMLAAHASGRAGRSIHLGYWPPGQACEADDFASAQARLDDFVIDAAAICDGLAVLDVACGLGGLLATLDTRFRGMELTGVNHDPRQLDACHRVRPRPDTILRWVEADACRLPFADASFDRVLCVEAMFHFRSRDAFLREAFLRPGDAVRASLLVRRIIHLLHAVRPSLDVAARLESRDEELESIPVPPRDSGLGSPGAFRLTQQLLLEIEQELRSRGVDEDAGVQPAPRLLALEALPTRGDAGERIVAELYSRRRFLREGVEAIQQAAWDGMHRLVVVVDVGGSGDADLARLADAADQSRQLPRAR